MAQITQEQFARVKAITEGVTAVDSKQMQLQYLTMMLH